MNFGTKCLELNKVEVHVQCLYIETKNQKGQGYNIV